MSAVAFDTLKLARKLRDTAHMSAEQAEGIADALAEAMSGAELATKRDLADVQRDLKSDIEQVELRLNASIVSVKAELAEAKTDILRWMFATVIGQAALIVTVLKLWH